MAVLGTFDFVIVGAGSAGCVLAHRLSASGKHKVLLVEAGPDDRSPMIHMPLGYAELIQSKQLNWRFYTAPEPGLDGRRLYQPRGKTLGGTSSINGMLYVRGSRHDYDNWERQGCPGWGWEGVLPYFKKSENQARGSNEFHGVGGPLAVTDPPTRDELSEALVTAGQQFGLPLNTDFNGETQDGIGYYQTTIARGRRMSTAQAFLRPARKRTNLTVVTCGEVQRLLLAGRQAKGVEFKSREGRIQNAFADREVILAAGVFGTPKTLLLSGIGAAAQLGAYGIETVHDSAGVGENVQDHFCVPIKFRCKKPITVNEIAHSFVRQGLYGTQYALMRRGPFAQNGIPVGAFLKSNSKVGNPDLQITVSNWSIDDNENAKPTAHRFPGFTLTGIHLHPDARGSVRLAGSDPQQDPDIKFGFLSTSRDVKLASEIVKIIRMICSKPAMEDYTAEEILPGEQVQTADAIERFLRQYGTSNNHAVGSCKMGTDPAAVVDPQLKVRGIGRLRVADASVMPVIPSGNTNAATIMIAEKCADMILTSTKVS